MLRQERHRSVSSNAKRPLAPWRQPLDGRGRSLTPSPHRRAAVSLDRFNITRRLSKIPIRFQISLRGVLHGVIDFAKHRAKEESPATITSKLRQLYGG
jgi:Leu/Phe-tRNA-protein transferase